MRGSFGKMRSDYHSRQMGRKQGASQVLPVVHVSLGRKTGEQLRHAGDLSALGELKCAVNNTETLFHGDTECK
jgi:hypothetical protein